MIAEKPTVHRLMDEVRRLTTQEQLDLIEAIAALVRTALPPQPTRSVLELGIGRSRLARRARPGLCGTGACDMGWVEDLFGYTIALDIFACSYRDEANRS
ncbi:MAG: hypothetical protein IT331_12760 [Anaerolineae bacterium]|nr:hypothetical protein [Anaerolineae bacterium]